MKSFRLDTAAGGSGSLRRENTKALILVGIVLLLAFGWSQNTFDNFLWRVHLNHSDCIQNGFGATFCGDAATTYQKRLRDAGISP
jgi:hypothetical protein